MDNFSILLTKDNIRKLVASYDYEAALSLAEEIKAHITENCWKLLKTGSERLRLNKSAVDKLVKDLPYDVIPVKSTNQRTVFEYVLSLKVKQMRGEYADFIRALTPLTADLVETILKKQCNIDLNTYCRVDGKGVRRFDPKKLDGTEILKILNEEFAGNFKAELVGTRQIAPLIVHYSDDVKLKTDLLKILDVEQKIRNLTAHEIVSVTPEWIQKKSGCTVEQIFDMLKYLVMKAGIRANKEQWDSFDTMNEYIYSELEK